MPSRIPFLTLVLLLSFKQSVPQEASGKYIFFLHNAFLETNDVDAEHPAYGLVEYNEVLQKFKANGFTVISEKRKGNVNAMQYAQVVNKQMDSLLNIAVPSHHITIVGTSKGGYIAQYVSTLAENPDLNFVFIGSFRESDIQQLPNINWCGNILNIYEESDPAGNSGLSRKETSSCEIIHYKDLELNTGLRHGFLFKALDAWMQPAMDWAGGNYK